MKNLLPLLQLLDGQVIALHATDERPRMARLTVLNDEQVRLGAIGPVDYDIELIYKITVRQNDFSEIYVH